MNMKSDPRFAAELWACSECGNLDSQSHIMWCPSFAPLREGLDISNDTDVVHYFQEVFKIEPWLRLLSAAQARQLCWPAWWGRRTGWQ